MPSSTGWRVAGSYFEVCNCEAICPCRQLNGAGGGRSTYGVCQFAVSWHIDEGSSEGLDLGGFDVVLVGRYNEDEQGSPWTVVLYVDDTADEAQHDALANIFLGRSGGDTLRNFAAAIRTVEAIRPAHINLEHRPRHESMSVLGRVAARTRHWFDSDDTVSCGIPGHDQPGHELVAEVMQVSDGSLTWEVRGRCGFATRFDYAAPPAT
jgi:hypothetical protein